MTAKSPKFKPLHDRVLVQLLDQEQTTAAGIVIPDNAQEKPTRGKVVAVGLGKPLDNGELRALQVKINDTVIFGKYAGTEIKVMGDNYIVMREDDIMGIIEA